MPAATPTATPLAAALLGLAPLLLAADGLDRGLDLSLLATLVLLPALALRRLMDRFGAGPAPPTPARAAAAGQPPPAALIVIAATAATAGGWVLAALLPRHGLALAALAPLAVANAAWWQRLATPAAAPLYPTVLLCLAPALAGLLREILLVTPLQPLAQQPAALFVLAAGLLAACRAFSPAAAPAGNTDA